MGNGMSSARQRARCAGSAAQPAALFLLSSSCPKSTLNPTGSLGGKVGAGGGGVGGGVVRWG